MYLKRITVAGFKSFAARTSLDFEPGIMAVVGPNGSGKSNLADAVRWALGEQNKSRLRLNERDEVVFAGTEKQARASFAEVILLFDNQDGAFGLDLTEVEISRRLYRSGESEYRLAGKLARLSDISAYLAEAGFGVGSYAVIGQGTIDNFIMSSPSERKLLFDEAAGIRGAELRREASLRKLTAVEANLVRLRDIAAELEPRLSSLSKQMTVADELADMTAVLATNRQLYLDNSVQQYLEVVVNYQQSIDKLVLDLDRLQYEAATLEQTQSERLAATADAESKSREIREKIADLNREREELLAAQSGLTAQIAQAEHLQSEARAVESRRKIIAAKLTEANDRLAETDRQLQDNEEADRRAKAALQSAAEKVGVVQAELTSIRREASEGTQEQYIGNALAILRTLAINFEQSEVDIEAARLLVHKAGRLLSHANRSGGADLLQRIRSAQVKLEKAMARHETAVEHQGNYVITQRSLELDRAHHEEAYKQLEEVMEELDSRAETFVNQLAQTADLQQATVDIAASLRQNELDLTESQNAIIDQSSSNNTQQIVEEAARLERLRSQITSNQAEQANHEAALGNARRELAEILELGGAWGMEAGVPSKLIGDTQALQQSLIELEAKISARRQLVDDNSAEYEDVSTRSAELKQQIEDLEVGRENMLKIVAELNDLIRERFKANFAQLAEQFGAYFVRLFDGGKAALELTEDENGLFGIDIKASPQGKRLTSLSALSGGERALTGVALLAAIMSVNPSPFVVLDEIDAALDEANSGRLADILLELRNQSQLIVITHNRQTMQAAKALFGVTMNDRHVSKVVSLQLDDAEALAAR